MIEHLVVDSGGFLKNCPIQEMCKNAYTIPGVISEIRDKQTRDRLKVRLYYVQCMLYYVCYILFSFVLILRHLWWLG